MIPKEQLKLLETWRNDIFGELSISEIMGLSKKKTKPWVFNALKELTKCNLLIAKRKANINLYRLNLDNPLLIQTLQYLEAQNYLDFPYLKIIMGLIGRIPIKNYCLLIFDEKRGLNFCFLIEDKETEKRIRPYVKEIISNYSLRISEYYINFDDFIRMLLVEEENIGKQIFRERKLFLNADIYYGLVKEAYKKGFR